jgi:hypothetical protein
MTAERPLADTAVRCHHRGDPAFRSSIGVVLPGGGGFRPAAAPLVATLKSMAKQSKKPADLNSLAAAIVGDATDETPQEPEPGQVRAGRAGGRKGGQSRAEQRSAIARKAAEARWRR